MATTDLIKKLRALLGPECVMSHEADRLAYSYDAATLEQTMPAVAVRPTRADQLGPIVELCGRYAAPLTVRGAGSNLSGGAIPSPGGVVLLTGGLNRIIEVNPADLYAVVEPGVVTARLAARVAGQGLFYPPDPGSQAVSTLGGNVAENAGGLRGLKYGVTRDYVMGLEFIAADGTLVKTGAATVKCVTGYNLAGLMVGSEGTLGLISRITLKLIPPPRASRAMLATFEDVAAAGRAVAAIIAERIVPATLELMDNYTIRAVENYAAVGLPTEAGALLLIEVDGHPAQVADDAEVVARLCRQGGAGEVTVAADAAQRDRVWEARRAALAALARQKPTLVLEDATVPRSKIPAMVAAIEEVAAELDLTIGTFGHAGDGNLHPTILCDRRDQEQWQRVDEAITELFRRAIDLGGTLSGEHGIGLAKSRFLAMETGAATIAWSRRLKKALDPAGMFNPGKVIGPS